MSTTTAAPHTSAPATAVGGVAQDINATAGSNLGLNIAHPDVPSDPAPMNQNIKEVSFIDPYLKTNYVATATFTWDVNAITGQLIWVTPVSPLHTHPNIEYIAKMYNGWVGSIDFNVLLGGTGFTGGKLIIVKFPNNIEPRNNMTMAELTMFNYTIIDPKCMEALQASGSDVRNVFFHYNAGFQGKRDLEINQIGGYIAMYVFLPLITSNTATTAISGAIFTKLGQDFEFAQMIPITLTESTPVPTYPMFGKFSTNNNADPWVCARMNTVMSVSESATIGANAKALVGMNGQATFPLSLADVTAGYQVTGRLHFGNHSKLGSFTSSTNDEIEQDLGFYLNGPFPVHGTVYVQGTAMIQTTCTKISFNISGADDTTWARTPNIETETLVNGKGIINVFNRDIVNAPMKPIDSAILITQILGERIIYFAPKSKEAIGSFTSKFDKELLLTGIFKNETLTPIFLIVDRSSGLGLGLVRFNLQGYFSTRLPAATLFQLKEIDLVYQYSLPTVTSLPAVDAVQQLVNRHYK